MCTIKRGRLEIKRGDTGEREKKKKCLGHRRRGKVKKRKGGPWEDK